MVAMVSGRRTRIDYAAGGQASWSRPLTAFWVGSLVIASAAAGARSGLSVLQRRQPEVKSQLKGYCSISEPVGLSGWYRAR